MNDPIYTGSQGLVERYAHAKRWHRQKVCSGISHTLFWASAIQRRERSECAWSSSLEHNREITGSCMDKGVLESQDLKVKYKEKGIFGRGCREEPHKQTLNDEKNIETRVDDFGQEVESMKAQRHMSLMLQRVQKAKLAVYPFMATCTTGKVEQQVSED